MQYVAWMKGTVDVRQHPIDTLFSAPNPPPLCMNEEASAIKSLLPEIHAKLHAWCGLCMRLWGVFAQRVRSAGTAPIITLLIPGTPLKTTHRQKHARPTQNSMQCRIRDPGTRGKHQTYKKKSLVYQQGL